MYDVAQRSRIPRAGVARLFHLFVPYVVVSELCDLFVSSTGEPPDSGLPHRAADVGDDPGLQAECDAGPGGGGDECANDPTSANPRGPSQAQSQARHALPPQPFSIR